MPAPASSGAMFTPISDSTVMPATRISTTSSAVRIIGCSVRSRVSRWVAPIAVRCSICRYSQKFANSQTEAASASAIRMVTPLDNTRVPQ